MRISDWSSDLCSSDLRLALHAVGRTAARRKRRDRGSRQRGGHPFRIAAGSVCDRLDRAGHRHPDRKSVVQGKRVSVRVVLGGRRIIKKRNKVVMTTIYLLSTIP